MSGEGAVMQRPAATRGDRRQTAAECPLAHLTAPGKAVGKVNAFSTESIQGKPVSSLKFFFLQLMSHSLSSLAMKLQRYRSKWENLNQKTNPKVIKDCYSLQRDTVAVTPEDPRAQPPQPGDR